jgi:hypothetical protein
MTCYLSRYQRWLNFNSFGGNIQTIVLGLGIPDQSEGGGRQGSWGNLLGTFGWEWRMTLTQGFHGGRWEKRQWHEPVIVRGQCVNDSQYFLRAYYMSKLCSIDFYKADNPEVVLINPINIALIINFISTRKLRKVKAICSWSHSESKPILLLPTSLICFPIVSSRPGETLCSVRVWAIGRGKMAEALKI